MSDSIKQDVTLSTPLERIAVKLDELNEIVKQQGQLLAIFDQYMLMNKTFFDQVRINKPADPKAEVK
jgi:hypothetical protein